MPRTKVFCGLHNCTEDSLRWAFPSGQLLVLCDLIMYSGSIQTAYLVMSSSPSYKSKCVKHLVVLMLQIINRAFDVVTRTSDIVTRGL